MSRNFNWSYHRQYFSTQNQSIRCSGYGLPKSLKFVKRQKSMWPFWPWNSKTMLIFAVIGISRLVFEISMQRFNSQLRFEKSHAIFLRLTLVEGQILATEWWMPSNIVSLLLGIHHSVEYLFLVALLTISLHSDIGIRRYFTEDQFSTVLHHCGVVYYGQTVQTRP